MHNIILSARPYSMKSNLFLAFGSLISNAEVENEIISDHIIVCPNLMEFDCCFFFFFFYSVYVPRHEKTNSVVSKHF